MNSEHSANVSRPVHDSVECADENMPESFCLDSSTFEQSIIKVKDEPSLEFEETQVKSEISHVLDVECMKFIDNWFVEFKVEFVDEPDIETVFPVKSEYNGNTKCESDYVSSTNSLSFDVKVVGLESTDTTTSAIPLIEIPEQATRLIGNKPQFKCIICDHACTTPALLTQHLQSHSREKAFKCSLCDHACAQRSLLTQHIKTHSAGKTFKCRFCDYTTTVFRNLTQHMRKEHIRKIPFKCHLCEYSAMQQGPLRNHIRKTHIGSKPFKCEKCDYTSEMPNNLSQHVIRMHKGGV